MNTREISDIVFRLRGELDRLDALGESMAAAQLSLAVETLAQNENRVRDASSPRCANWIVPDE